MLFWGTLKILNTASETQLEVLVREMKVDSQKNGGLQETMDLEQLIRSVGGLEPPNLLLESEARLKALP